MNRSSNRAPAPLRPLAHALLVAVVLSLGVLSSLSCLQPETVPQLTRACTCSGIRCVNSVVGKLSYSSDDEADECSGCHVSELARCALGCGPVESSPRIKSECPVAYTCRAWTRVGAGTACTTDRDCEPGTVSGEATATLACVNGVCADAGAAKWSAAVMPARECTGDPEFGPHPSCDGAPCVSPEPYGAKRYCSVAKCLEDGDCPAHWRCSCREEYALEGLNAHRWCVPDLANFPAESIIPLQGSSSN